MPDLTVVSWNINRGLMFDRVASTLEALRPDVVLLQEADLNARRTARRDVAGDLARVLGMKHVFGAEFRELGQETAGAYAYHGQALLAYGQINGARVLRFNSQTEYWNPRWYVPNLALFQRRFGGRIALIAKLDIGGRRVVLYNTHLESRGSEALRADQVEEILADTRRFPRDTGIIVAGDFNNRRLPSLVLKRLAEEGFRRAAPRESEITTVKGRMIDWIFIRGPLSAACGKVISDVNSSDHFPVVAKISLQ